MKIKSVLNAIVGMMIFSVSFGQNQIDPNSERYQFLKASGQVEQSDQIDYNGDFPKVSPSNTKSGLIIPLDGTFTVALGPNDDGSTSQMTLPFSFTFYGDMLNNFYINNNGNISFGSPYGEYTSTGFPVDDFPMLAPFWADVDTRGANSGLVHYRLEPNRLVVIWDHVGYYNSQSDKLNTFELIVTDGTDPLIGVGNNVAFCFADMQWTTGSASSGSGGFGGTPATVGINKGDGTNFALVGRFDHEGTDYDGPGGGNDGISYLDDKCFFFNTGVQFNNIPPVAQGTPTVQPIDLMVGEDYNLTMSFLSPEVDQLTVAIVNTFGLSGFTYTVTPGNVCAVEMDLLATQDNIGLHEIEIIATDNGTPPESTAINLSFNIYSLDPVINVDPLSLSESLYPDETSTQILTISNTGDADLVFDLDDLETSKRLRIKSIKKNSNGDNPDDFINYLNDQLKNGVANIREVSWLSETPLNGTIAPGEMMEIEVAFDATGLAVDVYNAQIIITSNDPGNPQLVVPVTLQVLGMNCIHITTEDNENNALQGIPDYDMDAYLYKYDPQAPIEFNIFVDEVNIESAQLSIYAWDVDELQGEVDEVYINGHFLGALTGANDEWSTTIFNVDPTFLNPGPYGTNLIQVFIDVATNGDWAVNVDWGQLIINNCMGDHAFIRYVEVDKPFYLPGEPVVAEIEVDTDLPTQTVIVETNLLNPDMINIDGFSTTKVIQYEEDEPFSVHFTLPVTAIMDNVFYVQVIVYDAATYLQQDLKLVPLLIKDDFLVCMEPGWQLISSYIEPLNPSVVDIMSDLVSDDALVIMLSKLGFYWPSQNINSLNDWDLNSGYKVKLSKAGCLFIDGEETVLKTVNLEEGFNYLPVLSSENVSASQIFEQIEDFMLYAFDLKQGLVYWPQGGLYTLNTLEPGNAYLITMLQDGSVTYPVKSANPIENYNQPIVTKHSPWEVRNTGNPHIISIFEAALADLKQGDIIAAFNTEGVCVGVTQVAGEAGNLPLVVYGNDLTTELVDGLVEGEAITLKVYDPMTQNVTEVYPVWDNKMPNNGQFAENGLSAIMSLKAGTSVSEPSLSNLSIYPNPNTGTFNVTGIDEPVEIQVINTTGQVIERFNTKQSIEINLSNFAKGIYYLKVVSDQSIRVEKIIIK